MKDRIIELLGRGIPAVQVALAVGCDESYISQVVSEDGVAAQISALKMEHFESYTALDDSADEAEEAALKKVKQLIPFITKPSEAANVYRVLNQAKRRTADAVSSAQSAQSTVVNLQLPAAARVAFITDHNRQVIEIDSRPLVTMGAQSLVKVSEQVRAAKLLSTSVPQILDIEVGSLAARL